jgi:hypothetical protein
MLKKTVIFIYSGARIFPQTDLYRRAIKEGIISEKASLLMPVFYFSPQIDIESMNKALEREAMTRREFIFPADKGKLMIGAMSVFGYKGLLWDRLVSFSNNTMRRQRKS